MDKHEISIHETVLENANDPRRALYRVRYHHIPSKTRYEFTFRMDISWMLDERERKFFADLFARRLALQYHPA
jgi:hypothetical protein